MKKILLFLFVVLCWSCQNDVAPKATYIHGEIVNPFLNYIILSKNDNLIDTIPLNKNNTFSYNLQNAKEGLYTFKHASENQALYMVPGDSILFRLNTLAFDETLFYSGTAAAKNNFLMELFLTNEKNGDLIFSFFKINPEDFAHITDSIAEIRKKKFKRLQEKNDFSEDFVSLVKKSIMYGSYDLREQYAFLLQKYLAPKKKIPNDFFDYRKNVDFNDESLQSQYVYQRFLDNYLKTRSIEDCGPRSKNRACYNLNDFNNLRRRILLVDSLFTLDVLKNRFYQRYGRKQIIFSNTEEQIDSTLRLLSRLNYTESGLKELKNLGEIQRSYFIGNNISDKKMIDSKKNPVVMKDVLTKPTITFAWTVDSPKDHQEKHEKIKNLRKKYPEINFIGINIDSAEPYAWNNAMEQFGYNKDFEYQLRDVGRKKMLYKNYLSKVLFINEEGEVIFEDITLDTPNFEGYILEFLNQ